MFTAILNQLD